MWRVFAFAVVLILAAPGAASASPGNDVRARCAATAWDGAACGRLAQIADALVASDDVSEQLAGEVDALPIEQREWLAGVLGQLADEASAASAEDESDEGFAIRGVPGTDGPRPPSNTIADALRKARDFIRRKIG